MFLDIIIGQIISVIHFNNVWGRGGGEKCRKIIGYKYSLVITVTTKLSICITNEWKGHTPFPHEIHSPTRDQT